MCDFKLVIVTKRLIKPVFDMDDIVMDKPFNVQR